jgi:hypothetical protein
MTLRGIPLGANNPMKHTPTRNISLLSVVAVVFFGFFFGFQFSFAF